MVSCEFFSNKGIVSKKKFIQKDLLSNFIQKGLHKFIKSLPNWIYVLASIHFPFSLLSSRYFCIKNDHWAKKLSSLNSSPLIINPLLISHSLSLSLVYSIWAITQSFLVHLYIVHSLAPTHLSQETKLTLKLKKYQQPCPTMRKMIFSWIHHDIHQEIAYDVHNSLYNMIDYFSWPNLWIYHNNLIFYGHKSSNNV
jgi:hypothetical protein